MEQTYLEPERVELIDLILSDQRLAEYLCNLLKESAKLELDQEASSEQSE